MTALDDALNSSAPLFAPPRLLVDWEETPDTENTTPENLADLTDMLDGTWSVSHSFDDALPDPVTMTNSSDASGTLSAGLLGREGVVLTSFSSGGWTAQSNDYDSVSIPTALPSGVQHGDYVVVAVCIPSNSAILTEQYDVDTNRKWDRLAFQTDGPITLYVYGRHHYTGMVAPSFTSSVSVAFVTWATTRVRATAPDGNPLRWRITSLIGSVAPSSVTSHQAGTLAISSKGYMLGVWAADGTKTWSGSASGSILAQDTTVNTTIALTQTGWISPPESYPLSLNTNVATANAVYFAMALEPDERPRMMPIEFWSPFNNRSPVYGFDRDTATVQFDFQVVTSAGVEPTTVFFGIMSDVGLSGTQAVTMEAVSRLRINLNRSVNLPLVFGRREGCTTDYLISWILARADRFFGPAPSYMSRYWAPCYGSIHAAQDAFNGYNFAMYWDATYSNVGVRYPRIIAGPFHTAMWACHTTNYTQELVFNAMDLYKSTEVVPPWVSENFIKGQYLQDQFSGTNAVGRISFWIRGDATNNPVANVPAGNNYLWQYTIESKNASGTTLGRVWASFGPNDRKLSIQMGTAAGGYASLVWGSGFDIPTDGNWHFYSIAWSWWDGAVSVMRDGTISTSNYWGTNGLNGTTGWYTTDQALYDSGGKIDNIIRSHLPISDMSIEASWEVYSKNFADQWPTMPWPSFTAFTRPTMSPVEFVDGGEPVNAWDTISSLARNTMSAYRANELDSFEVFPPSYFGEASQLDSDTVADTDVNAQELAIVSDPSKSRNVVTVSFQDTKVDEKISAALMLNTATAIPPGTSDLIFTLDEPIAEIHGAATPNSAIWTITNLTGSQVTAGAGPVGSHYMTVNTLADGSGAVTGPLSVTAKIIDYTSSSVTIRFVNKTGATYYLANNYNGDLQLPSLKILGYVVRQADAYVTERDAGSIGTRRERSLDSQMDWVTDRATATQLAGHLVTQLARPRAEVTVRVQGDPRRKPGHMVTLADAQGTRAAGLWRVMSVEHEGDGAQYTQTLKLVYVPPIAVWDAGPWDNSIWSP